MMTMCFCKPAQAVERSPCWVLLALLAAASLHTACAQAQSSDNWNTPAEPFTVIGNIHYVGTAGLASFLITTEQGHILLDGALAESATLIEANIVALGFQLADVKYLLNSHAHFDHSGGLAQLKRDTGATLVASEGDRSALEGGFYLGSEDVARFKAPPVKVDRVIADGETLKLGSTVLTANLTPGHSRGCTSWSMPVMHQDQQQQVLFFCSTSVAANRLVNPPQYPGIVADYEATFAKLKTFKVDVFLGAHPEFFGMAAKRIQQRAGGSNPFIDSSPQFQAYLEKSRLAFRRQLAEQLAKAKAAPKAAP
jgi:metallo-beta-lactamase class B